MKTKITLLFLLLVINFTSKAQTYVTIPDANFVAWLQINIPSAMNGNQMDTSNTAVTIRSRIDVENKGITDLTGIQYFDSLKTLDCGNGTPSTNPNTLVNLPTLPTLLDTLICGRNVLTSLPVLPNTIKYLYCYNNQLTSLPALSDSLISFACNNNQINSLPALPSLLKNLYCSFNQLTSIPTLPNSLRQFWCEFNQLTSLPTFPGQLIDIKCGYNQITSLPALPSSLHSLNCFSNQLTVIPTLPNNISTFICGGNHLTSLPTLGTHLVFFECSSNQLTSLPNFQSPLQYVQCNNNLLICIPALPNTITWLWCQNNNITCLPPLPTSLIVANQFDISGNPFTCLPNYVAGMDANTLSYPLCVLGDTINNPNGCVSSRGVAGFTYNDTNYNCLKDSADLNIVNIPLKIYDYNNNQLGLTYSALNGIYDFYDTIGTYTIKVDTAGMPFKSFCPYPGIDSTVTLTLYNSLQKNVNFELTCKPGFDVGIQSVVPICLVFPGIQHRLRINAGDLSHWYNLNCANGISGQLQVTVSGPVTYAGIIPGALTPIIAGNTFTYSIADFGLINNSQDFGLRFNTNTSAQAGDQICVDLSITPVNGDNDTTNNYRHFCYEVVNSHDPNMKEVYPIDVLPGYQDWFTYTVHFQNTGTAYAMNISLVDTIDNNLDLKTFQVMNYSHFNITSLNGNILTFRFPNIQLPDSTSNSEGSQGFVQYRIKPKANLPLGTQITNTANIYFDYNNPINTNTTVNTFTNTANVQNLSSTINSVLISPNPFTSQTTIMFDKEQKNTTIKIMDVLGKEIKTINFSGKQLVLEKGEMQKGIYFVQIVDESFDKLRRTNVVNKKILIQ